MNAASTFARLAITASAAGAAFIAAPVAAQKAPDGPDSLNYQLGAPVADQSARAVLIPGTCSRPEYPQSSIRKQEQGISIIQLKLDADGVVTDASVRQSSGSRLLDQVAAFAMSACRFKPARDEKGAAIRSVYSDSVEWRLQDAPKDPWVGLRALAGAGFAPTSDFAAIPFSGDSAGDPDQRAKILQAARDEAVDKAQCPSVERASARIARSDNKSGRRSFESWTLDQCGQSIRYIVAITFPDGKRPQFRMMPLAAGEADPFAQR